MFSKNMAVVIYNHPSLPCSWPTVWRRICVPLQVLGDRLFGRRVSDGSWISARLYTTSCTFGISSILILVSGSCSWEPADEKRGTCWGIEVEDDSACGISLHDAYVIFGVLPAWVPRHRGIVQYWVDQVLAAVRMDGGCNDILLCLCGRRHLWRWLLQQLPGHVHIKGEIRSIPHPAFAQ